MNTYKVTMDNGTRLDVNARSAADAIQSALEKHLGHRVKECCRGDIHSPEKGLIRYDVPPHDPVTEKTSRTPRVKGEPESDENKAMREKNAPWIEEWLKGRAESRGFNL